MHVDDDVHHMKNKIINIIGNWYFAHNNWNF